MDLSGRGEIRETERPTHALPVPEHTIGSVAAVEAEVQALVGATAEPPGALGERHQEAIGPHPKGHQGGHARAKCPAMQHHPHPTPEAPRRATGMRLSLAQQPSEEQARRTWGREDSLPRRGKGASMPLSAPT